MKSFLNSFLAVCLGMLAATAAAADQPAESAPLPGTAPLTLGGDIASHLVDGVDRFLLKELERSLSLRSAHWKRDLSSAEAYRDSVKKNRARLAHILGVRDPRHPVKSLELLATTSESSVAGKSARFRIQAVRWPVLGGVHGEGFLLTPLEGKPIANIVAIPDADQIPESIVGLTDSVPTGSQFARRLAESGCRVLVPTLVDRSLSARHNRATLSQREYLYRSAFELGRHLIGYELQKVMAGIDWFEQLGDPAVPIGVFGWGEGGMLALYAAALDQRIAAVGVSGYFDSRQEIWREPLSRNVFGLLEQFGDAELATLVCPRPVIVEACRGPELTLPGKGGGPARLQTPQLSVVRAEVARAAQLVPFGAFPTWNIQLVEVEHGKGECGSTAALSAFLHLLAVEASLASELTEIQLGDKRVSAAERAARQIDEIDQHNQWLLRESPYVRREFMKKLDFSSAEAYARSVEAYREIFRQEVIGSFPHQRLAPQVRSRKSYDNDKWTGYEVVMDVFPDVIAYGILLLPKGMKPDEKRPVVVCQHGLEGRPQDVVSGDKGAYHDFAAKLAERGYITFAPQNLYIFQDRFRTLQRKANPLKKTLFSVIVPQHQQIVDWLATLPNVDPQRIAFYGLSYGGKSAMRIPPLVEKYCLSICSADFNEWVWKNTSTRSPYSYVWTGEYEIFEFDLGSTFNYAEMAALIAPRPFMVERGHFDGVAPDETVAYEFAKVRRLYAAQLRLADRCQIEWFVGPHTINGKGTFQFLDKHLLNR